MIDFDDVTGFKFPLRIAYLDNDEQAIVHAVGDATPGRRFRILESRDTPHPGQGVGLEANE